MKIELSLEEKEGKFELIDNNDIIGELCFILKDKQMIINHTGVNPKFRGKGWAEKLILEAIDYARKHKLKIIPFCSYVSYYIGKNQEVKDLT